MVFKIIITLCTFVILRDECQRPTERSLVVFHFSSNEYIPLLQVFTSRALLHCLEHQKSNLKKRNTTLKSVVNDY